jgi:hypothetical protein
MRLIQIFDSTAHFNGAFGVHYTFFFYDSLGRLTKSQRFQENFSDSPNHEYFYYYDPFKSITLRKRDSLIVYQMTSEYDYDFFTKRSYGYVWEPKLKDGIAIHGQDTSKYQYSDYKDPQKFNQDKTLKNIYNPTRQIMSSKISSVFMNDRTVIHKLIYSYHSNGLLKSVRGDVPEFFEYEYEK